ncbi:hypothetical protein SCLCIDRAFT_1213274 [Scleroderma citrinum Foug A]|uniref:Uncharacterized protein n=1 Tax=Scleroderma citrinum Foug A TaxID=1036808 RepID=A0A0C3E8Y4_9AGAM|nr:hypothetical protein SCLCIDRAFT_1213274 [Scleroderma citrinum Foug A]
MCGGTVDSTRVEGKRLCRLEHPAGLSDVEGDTEESKSHLEASVERWRSKPLTLDVATHCGRCYACEMLNKLAARYRMQGERQREYG